MIGSVGTAKVLTNSKIATAIPLNMMSDVNTFYNKNSIIIYLILS